jgi:hypothetical protein
MHLANLRSSLLALNLCVLGSAPALAAAKLRVGVAEVDITPPKGLRLAGYYHERLATGTLYPLKARAIVFLGEREQAAWVVCDLIGIASDLTAAVRRAASEKTGIPPGNILVSATHTHTAPDYTKDLYEYQGEGADGKRKDRYAAKLIAGITAALVQAHDRARPVVIEAGSAIQDVPVSFNRRFVLKDGSVRTWMSLDNPEVVRPAGPIDPEIGLLLVRVADDRSPLGLISNFALHLDTVGGTLWAPDYPHFIEQQVQRALGNGMVSLFGTGCCGDINHVDPARKERNKTDFIGMALGKTITGGLPGLRRVEEILHFRRNVVRLPMQKVTAEQVARAQPVLLDARAGKKVDFYEQVLAYKTMMLDHLQNKEAHARTTDFISWGLSRTLAGVGDQLPVEVAVLALGPDVAIVFLPGEVFVDLGLAIKRASPFKTTLVVELSNAVETIYIPTRAAYASGSYEVTNAALEPGSGEVLVEAAIRLLREAATDNVRSSMPVKRP